MSEISSTSSRTSSSSKAVSTSNVAGSETDRENNEEKLDRRSSSSSSISRVSLKDVDDPEAFCPDTSAAGESLYDANRTVSRILTNAEEIEANTVKCQNEELPFGMGFNKPFPPELPDKKLYSVTFDGPNDPLHPHNWAWSKKITFFFLLVMYTFSLAFSSAAYSPAVDVLAEKYHVNEVVTTLGVSLYVLGFASGPVIYAPLSELYGRKPILIISSFLFTVFQFAVATAENLQTILICRFFGSFTGSSALVVVPAAFADMFPNKYRGNAINCFAMVVFVGPLIAPIVGTFITESYLGWRWTSYITGIMGGFASLCICLFFEETHHPIILVNKARYLRRRTGNWGIYAPQEEATLTFREILENNISRPVKLLFTEPIIFLLSIYNAFIYGILYLFLTAYPLVFYDGYKMKAGVSELPYLGLVIGMLIGGLYCMYVEKSCNEKMKANNNKPVPEARLPPIMVGGIAFPIGLFWFTWSGNYHESVHWMVPTASGLFSGFGLLTIFIPSLNYIVDSYLILAASALAANTLVRSAFATAFPLFAKFMFVGMGTNWAGLLIGLVGVALAPVPFAFYIYGKRIREKSKYAFVL
ncbi:hypothetical protein PACTADRAFT_74695 [Pachysolen tannophilus NRRL Y-2460]|uniref:Major facilitator superfamily (MFS) profile domain-containing protein n=1 Tax=Pachysolen tannophilus NRRL Y-2460 TaxID=669874 RepID=A0A1E4TZG4_PACTA|nr:hypothetical protein PACTADRAFT_74695 [Pachysolen tannophilus NRRL Y-2460]